MKVIETDFPDVKLLQPDVYRDDRGVFFEAYNRQAFTNCGINLDFVQDNYSYSHAIGTVRGLHFQIPPFAQDKLVRIARGSVLDVVVDIRHASLTFGKHISFLLKAGDQRQLLIPRGFAHGLCTLEPETEITYKVTNYYSPAHDKGIRWNDPAIGVDWPVSPGKVVISAKDKILPLLDELQGHFEYPDFTRDHEALSA